MMLYEIHPQCLATHLNKRIIICLDTKIIYKTIVKEDEKLNSSVFHMQDVKHGTFIFVSCSVLKSFKRVEISTLFFTAIMQTKSCIREWPLGYVVTLDNGNIQAN